MSITEDFKFEIGQRVRIKNNLEKYKRYNGLGLLESMFNLKGKEGTIKISRIGYVDYKYINIYELNADLDPSSFAWSEDMLEAVEEPKENTVKTLSDRILKNFPLKPIVTMANIVPINDRRYNLIEILIEIESDKTVGRSFRKLYAESEYIESFPKSNEADFTGAFIPFHVYISIEDEYESLEHDWYEVDRLWNTV